MNRKSRLWSKNSPSPSSSLKKSNNGSKASTSTPSKTPTRQLTMEEILERQREKQRIIGRSTQKVLFDSESSNSNSPGKLVAPASFYDKKPGVEPLTRTNKLSLGRKRQISNSSTSSTSMDKGTHLYGEKGKVNTNKNVRGFSGDNEEALDVEECWSSLKSMETKPTNFGTPSKDPPAQRDVTPSSVSRRRTPSTPSSTTKLNPGIPFVHKKVRTPSPAAASSASRDLKQTALASPTSFIKRFNAFSTPTTANTLSSDKKAKSRTKLLMGNSNVNVQYPKKNFEKAVTSNPRNSKKSLSIFDDSDEESSDSGIHLENRSVGFSPSKSTCSVSCASTFTDVLSEEASCSSVDATRPGCLAPQQAWTPSSSSERHDEKGVKRSNASLTLDDTPTSSKRLKLSLKSRRSHISSTSTSEKCLSDMKIKMEPAACDSDVIATKSSPQPLSNVPTCSASSLNVIALNVDLNLVKSEIPSIEPQKQQRRNRFINKIPKCFADLKDCFKPLSPQNRKSTWSSSLLELPELRKQLGFEPPRIKYNENPSNVDPDSESPQLAYYWSNFLEITRSVLDIPDDRRLFNDNEIGTIRKYYTLSEDAQMLYSRLFVRHHKWHPSTTINYPEIADNLRPILKELISVDYIEGDDSLKDLETALGLLQVAQIKQLCKDCNVKCEATKVQCVRAILDNCSKHKPLFNGMGAEQERHSVILKRAKEKLRECYRVTDKPRSIFRRMMMLYSLSDTYWDSGQNENQPVQLTNLMHVNFGKLIYPSYEMERKTTIFRDRDDLLRYEIASTLESDIWSSMEAKKWSEAKLLCDNALVMYQNLIKDHATVQHELQLPDFLREYTPGYLLTRCLNYRVEVLQKLRCYEEANLQLKELLNQKSHCQHYRGYWIDRYALNAHQHLKLPLEALKTIEDGHKDPLVTEDHLLSLSARAERLRSSKQIDPALFENLKLFKISKAPEVEMNGQKLDKTPSGNKSFFYYEKYNANTSEMEAQACSVENFALQKYNEQGYPNGIHAEGSILISLFGLIFWDIIYTPGIPDAFRSPHQAFPLDLHSESFFNNRRTQLDRRLDVIKLSPLEEVTAMIDEHWKENEGRASIVSWDLLSCDDAMSLVGCIGSSCLHNICERLLRNLRHFRSGVPDLTVWNPTTKMWKMVEVKGPGDRLSNKQRIWLHFLMSIGAPVEVCYVQAVGGKKIANAGGISLEEC